MQKITLTNLKKAVEFMNMVKFGAHIARLRKERDMPQSALADSLNVTRQAVSKWERGEGFPDISMLGALADIFGITIDALLNAGEASKSTAEVLSSAAKNQEIAEEIFEDEGAIADIINIAPYLKISTLSEIADKLSRHNININNIIQLSEFMNDESIIKLLESSDPDAPDDRMLEKLIPFLDFESICSIFENIMKGQNGIQLIEVLRPHMGYAGTSLIEAAYMQGIHAPPSAAKKAPKTSGIALKGISKKYYNGVVAISNVNLKIKQGEAVAFLGPSGCGKTSLLRIIAGLEEITEGELYMGDSLVNEVEPKDRDVAMLFQNFALFPFMTIFENIAFGLKPANLPEEEIKRRTEEIGRTMDIAHVFDRKPRQVSVGQKARAALCRALVSERSNILLDEPLAYLDANQRPQLSAEIMKLRRKFSQTFIFVTHDQSEAMAIADRIVLMRDGVIVQDGTPEELYTQPNSVYSAGFIGTPQMNFWKTQVTEHDGKIYVNFGTAKISLPGKRLQPHIGKEIIAGIRPEHIYVGSMPTGVQAAEVDVKLSVYCGREENQLHFDLDEAHHDFIAFAQTESKAKPGDKVAIAVNPDKLHFFDKETKLAI